MKTKIKTIHNESYSGKNVVMGILLNYNVGEVLWTTPPRTLAYLYKNNIYCFYETMSDMFEDYVGDDKNIKRAYLSEEEFDNIYDAKYIDGEFNDFLTWSVFDNSNND